MNYIKVSTKRILINVFGGKCQICQYEGCDAAFAFHHKVPSEKKFEISKYKKKDLTNYLFLRELEKCILVCHRCHSEIHSGLHQDKIKEIPEMFLLEDSL